MENIWTDIPGTYNTYDRHKIHSNKQLEWPIMNIRISDEIMHARTEFIQYPPRSRTALIEDEDVLERRRFEMFGAKVDPTKALADNKKLARLFSQLRIPRHILPFPGVGLGGPPAPPLPPAPIPGGPAAPVPPPAAPVPPAGPSIINPGVRRAASSVASAARSAGTATVTVTRAAVNVGKIGANVTGSVASSLAGTASSTASWIGNWWSNRKTNAPDPSVLAITGPSTGTRRASPPPYVPASETPPPSYSPPPSYGQSTQTDPYERKTPSYVQSTQTDPYETKDDIYDSEYLDLEHELEEHHVDHVDPFVSNTPMAPVQEDDSVSIQDIIEDTAPLHHILQNLETIAKPTEAEKEEIISANTDVTRNISEMREQFMQQHQPENDVPEFPFGSLDQSSIETAPTQMPTPQSPSYVPTAEPVTKRLVRSEKEIANHMNRYHKNIYADWLTVFSFDDIKEDLLQIVEMEFYYNKKTEDGMKVHADYQNQTISAMEYQKSEKSITAELKEVLNSIDEIITKLNSAALRMKTVQSPDEPNLETPKLSDTQDSKISEWLNVLGERHPLIQEHIDGETTVDELNDALNVFDEQLSSKQYSNQQKRDITTNRNKLLKDIKKAKQAVRRTERQIKKAVTEEQKKT